MSDVAVTVRPDDCPWTLAIDDWAAWEHLHGPYCVYAAWEKWVSEQELLNDVTGQDILDNCHDKVALFLLMDRALNDR